jgi:hypothetical protein
MCCRGGEVLEGETQSLLELAVLTLEMAANYTCQALNWAATAAEGGEVFQLEIFGKFRIS